MQLLTSDVRLICQHPAVCITPVPLPQRLKIHYRCRCILWVTFSKDHSEFPWNLSSVKPTPETYPKYYRESFWIIIYRHRLEIKLTAIHLIWAQWESTELCVKWKLKLRIILTPSSLIFLTLWTKIEQLASTYCGELTETMPSYWI